MLLSWDFIIKIEKSCRASSLLYRETIHAPPQKKIEWPDNTFNFEKLISESWEVSYFNTILFRVTVFLRNVIFPWQKSTIDSQETGVFLL